MERAWFLPGICYLMSSFVWADTVILKNNSVIIGPVTDIKNNKLKIDSGYGLLTIPFSDIVERLSDTGETIVLTSKPAAKEGGEKAETDPWQWSGNANAYLNIQRGNSQLNTLNADGSVTARDELNRNIFCWKSEYEEDDKEQIKNRWLVKYNYNRFLLPTWYFFGSGSWEKDHVKALDYRVTAGLGVGHQFWDEPALRLRAELGGSQIVEQMDGSDKKDETPAIHWSLHYEQEVITPLTLFHDQDIYRRIDQNSWLIQTATGLRYKLTDLLHFTLRYEFDRDGNPKAGKKKDDSSLMFGLGASW